MSTVSGPKAAKDNTVSVTAVPTGAGFATFVEELGLRMAGTTVTNELLATVGPQSPDVWRQIARSTVEEVLGEESLETVGLDFLTPEEVVGLAGAAFKKLKKENRRTIIREIVATISGANAARQSLSPEPSRPGRERRTAAVEAENAIAGQLGQNVGGGLRQPKGQRQDDEIEDDSPSTESLESDTGESETNSDKETRSFKKKRTKLIDPTFRNPKVLFDVRRWEKAFRNGESIDDLRRQLRRQLSVGTLEAHHQNEWQTEVAGDLLEVLVAWFENPTKIAVGNDLLEILFRFHLWASGSGKDEIERGMSELKNFKLPKAFRKAVSKAKKKKQGSSYQPTRSTPAKATESQEQRFLPRDVWAKLSPEAKKAISTARKK